MFAIHYKKRRCRYTFSEFRVCATQMTLTITRNERIWPLCIPQLLWIRTHIENVMRYLIYDSKLVKNFLHAVLGNIYFSGRRARTIGRRNFEGLIIFSKTWRQAYLFKVVCNDLKFLHENRTCHHLCSQGSFGGNNLLFSI